MYVARECCATGYACSDVVKGCEGVRIHNGVQNVNTAAVERAATRSDPLALLLQRRSSCAWCTEQAWPSCGSNADSGATASEAFLGTASPKHWHANIHGDAQTCRRTGGRSCGYQRWTRESCKHVGTFRQSRPATDSSARLLPMALQARPPRKTGTGNAVANHPQGQEQQPMRLVAGCFQPRAAALQHQVAVGSIVESAPQCSSEGGAAGRTAVTQWHPPHSPLRRAVPSADATGTHRHQLVLARQQHAAPIGGDGHRAAHILVRCSQSTIRVQLEVVIIGYGIGVPAVRQRLPVLVGDGGRRHANRGVVSGIVVIHAGRQDQSRSVSEGKCRPGSQRDQLVRPIEHGGWLDGVPVVRCRRNPRQGVSREHLDLPMRKDIDLVPGGPSHHSPGGGRW